MSGPRTSTSTQYVACRHDAQDRPHFEWQDLAAFVEAGASIEDGLHTVHLPTGPHLDLLLRGRPMDPAHGTVCVFFNGAVGQRATKTGPFLSGAGVSRVLDVPLVSMADPTLLLSTDVGLSWYLGSAGANAQRPITDVLEHIGRTSGNHLLLSGGSGGGFAALQQAQALGTAASALVWNPQTDVLSYSPRLVKQYLAVAFPELEECLDGPDWKDRAREQFQRDGIQWELLSSFGRGPRMERWLCLQNWNDWHTRGHMVPLLNAMPGVRELWPGMYGPDERHVVWMTELGHGHVPPPASALQTLLGPLARTATTPLALAQEAEMLRMFPVKHRDSYVRDLRPFRDAVVRAVDISFEDGRTVTPRSDTLGAAFGGLRFRYEAVGSEGVQLEHGTLGRPYTVPEDAPWEYLLVRVLDGFDHELHTVRFHRRIG